MIVQGSCVFKRQHVVISFSKYFFFSQGCINFRVVMILGPLRLSQRCWPRQRGRRGSGLPPPPCHTPEVQTQFEIDKKIFKDCFVRIANKPYLLQRRSNKDPGGQGNPSLASRRDAEVKFSWSLKSLLLSILSSWSSVACKDLIRVEQCVFLLDPKPRTMFFGSLHHQVARFPLEKSPCCKMYLNRLFSPVVCVSWFLVVLVSLTEHNLVVSSSEIRSYVFLSEEVNISRPVGIPKEGHQVSWLLRSREGIISGAIVTWMGPYKGLQDGGRHRNCCPPPSSCSSHQSSR